ncbi:uncharacterized protein TNCV_957241 [Trichonephila clavipes]|nr:uncharacterized protein TNCV_957241 [Trichonephila clavipes]
MEQRPHFVTFSFQFDFTSRISTHILEQFVEFKSATYIYRLNEAHRTGVWKSVRYDISLSKASWPNLNHQQFVMNRSFEQWSHLPEALGLLDALEYDENTTDFVNDTFFRENILLSKYRVITIKDPLSKYCKKRTTAQNDFRFEPNVFEEREKVVYNYGRGLFRRTVSENLLRVHVFVEEMIYMSIEESYSYTLPKLMADLGGCLGLYLGVSVISIIEFIDLFGSATLLCLMGNKDFDSSLRRTGSRKRRRKNRTTDSGSRTSTGYFRRRVQSNKNYFRNVDQAWRNSAFSSRDNYYQNDSAARKQVMRWS